jgi:hypothetical protein
MSGGLMVTLRRTWHVHFDTDAEELLAGVQVGMVAGPRCRKHSHAALRALADPRYCRDSRAPPVPTCKRNGLCAIRLAISFGPVLGVEDLAAVTPLTPTAWVARPRRAARCVSFPARCTRRRPPHDCQPIWIEVCVPVPDAQVYAESCFQSSNWSWLRGQEVPSSPRLFGALPRPNRRGGWGRHPPRTARR